jgi:hypothetical protein
MPAFQATISEIKSTDYGGGTVAVTAWVTCQIGQVPSYGPTPLHVHPEFQSVPRQNAIPKQIAAALSHERAQLELVEPPKIRSGQIDLDYCGM